MIKKFLQFIAGLIIAAIIVWLPLILPITSGTALDMFIYAFLITTIVAVTLIIKRKTRFFGVGLIIPAGGLTILYIIGYLIWT